MEFPKRKGAGYPVDTLPLFSTSKNYKNPGSIYVLHGF